MNKRRGWERLVATFSEMSLSSFLYSSTSGAITRAIRSRLVMRRMFSTREKHLRRQVLVRRKESSLSSALSLFEELVSKEGNKEQAIESTLSTLMHFCERERDQEGGEEVMKMIDKYCPEPSESLASAVTNYLVTTKDRERLWGWYDRFMKNIPLRETVSLNLLQSAAVDKNKERVMEILEKHNHSNIEDEVVQSLMELAAEEERRGEQDWRKVGYHLMEKVSSNQLLINESTAMYIVKWLRSMWGGDENISVTNTSINDDGICSNCKQKMKDNKLTKSEHSLLLQHTKEMLLKEAHWYENGKPEEREIENFLKLCQKYGPFGVVVDALNILMEKGHFPAGCRKMKNYEKLVSFCNWASRYQPLPIIVIGRCHMKSIVRSVITKLPENVHFFYTSNRVADDYYYIYGSLSSGQNTLFITNDKLGDHVERVKNVDKSLIPIFQKWLRSTRVTYTYGIHPHWRSLEIPHSYDTMLQWTDDCWHIPTSDGTWYCIKRISNEIPTINKN